MELRATANNVQGQLSQAHEAAIQARKEAETLQQQSSRGSTSNALVQVDVALQLATAAGQIQALTSERDAAPTTAAQATAVIDLLKGQVKTAATAVSSLKTQRGTLASQVTALRGGRTRDRAEIQTLTTERDTAQKEVQQLRERADGFEVMR